jgi:hypothetical protein
MAAGINSVHVFSVMSPAFSTQRPVWGGWVQSTDHETPPEAHSWREKKITVCGTEQLAKPLGRRCLWGCSRSLRCGVCSWEWGWVTMGYVFGPLFLNPLRKGIRESIREPDWSLGDGYCGPVTLPACVTLGPPAFHVLGQPACQVLG